MAKVKSNRILFCTIIITFIFIFFYSYLYPLQADDFFFALAHNYYNGLNNNGLLENIAIDYTYWSGRVISLLLGYILLHKSYNAYSIYFISITTGICYIFLSYLLYQIAFREKPSAQSSSVYILLLVLLILYLLKILSIPEMLGFKTVTIQYFWGEVLFSYVALYAYKKQDTLKFFGCFTIFGAGFILGLYNEIIAASLLIFYLLFSFSWNYKKFARNIMKKTMYFYTGIILGLTILIAAPGNYNRKKIAMNMTHTANSHYTALQKISIALAKYYGMHIKILLSFIVVGLFCLSLYTIFLKNNPKYKEDLYYYYKLAIAFLLCLLLLSPFAYYYEGGISGRVTFIPDMLLFCLILGLLNLNAKIIFPLYKARVQSLRKPMLLILASIYFIFFVQILNYHHYYNQDVLDKINSSENKSFIFENYCPKNKLSNKLSLALVQKTLSSQPDFWVNRLFSEYYGVKSISFVNCQSRA